METIVRKYTRGKIESSLALKTSIPFSWSAKWTVGRKDGRGKVGGRYPIRNEILNPPFSRKFGILFVRADGEIISTSFDARPRKNGNWGQGRWSARVTRHAPRPGRFHARFVQKFSRDRRINCHVSHRSPNENQGSNFKIVRNIKMIVLALTILIMICTVWRQC